MSMVKIAKNIVFVLIFYFFFKISAINGTETLERCPQLVTKLLSVCPLLVTEIVGVCPRLRTEYPGVSFSRNRNDETVPMRENQLSVVQRGQL